MYKTTAPPWLLGTPVCMEDGEWEPCSLDLAEFVKGSPKMAMEHHSL